MLITHYLQAQLFKRAWNKAFCLASHREDSNITLITSYLILEQVREAYLCTSTIMMHAHPIRPHEIKYLHIYFGIHSYPTDIPKIKYLHIYMCVTCKYSSNHS